MLLFGLEAVPQHWSLGHAMELAIFTDASGCGRLDYDVFLDGQLAEERSFCVDGKPKHHGIWLPTSTQLEMAVIVEALKSGHDTMQKLAATKTPLRLNGWRLSIYNDNLPAVEYCSLLCHTPESMQAAGADHLIPLAHLAWSLSSGMSKAGAELRLRRPPKGRNSWRIRAVDRRTHQAVAADGPDRCAVCDEVREAIEVGIVVAMGMLEVGRGDLLGNL